MSAADYLVALYFKYLNINPKDCNKPDRDRFILSKGHSAVGYIPCLSLRGYFEKDKLKTFNHFMSPFGMHPDSLKVPGATAVQARWDTVFLSAWALPWRQAAKQTYKTVVMLVTENAAKARFMRL